MMHDEPFCLMRMSLKGPKVKVLKYRGGLFSHLRKRYKGYIGRPMFEIIARFHKIFQGILDWPPFCGEKGQYSLL